MKTLEEVRKVFEGDRFATENGAVIEEIGDHSATCSLIITDSHRNAMGAVMGGTYFMAEAVEDAFRYDRVVLATTTYNADIFPFMRTFIDHLTERNFSNKKVALIENGSWAPMAAKVMKGMLEKSKNLTYCENEVKIISALNDESKEKISLLAKELCN